MKIGVKWITSRAGVLGCVLCIGLEAAAQPNLAGKQVKGFAYPEYDADGQKIWELKGDALFETNDRLQLRNVRLETFEGGKLRFVFLATACVFDRSTKSAHSDEKVEVFGDCLTMEGKGFVWSGEEGKMLIRKEVRVSFSNLGKQFEELDKKTSPPLLQQESQP